MEGANQDLLSKLQQEKDWQHSCVLTDKQTVLVDNGCNLLPEEIKYVFLDFGFLIFFLF